MHVGRLPSSTIFTKRGPESIAATKRVVRKANDTLLNAGGDREDKRGLLFNAVIAQRRRIPMLESTGPVAAFRAADAIRLLSLRDKADRLPLVDGVDTKSRFTDFRLDLLDEISQSLGNLGGTLAALLDGDALNPKTAESSRPNLLTAAAGKNSPLAAFSVQPTAEAVGNVLVSDTQDTPIAQLGLTGSFFVNGFQVTVESTDSIFDLRDKINNGEDSNQNGILDLAEDANNNGVVDRQRISGNEFGGTLLVDEDRNNNGTLDAAEDTNDNDRLDGGSRETGVIASVRDNRLFLTNQIGGQNRIDLRDDDSILLALGFFEGDAKGQPVLKEQDFDSGNPPTNLIQEPQPAGIEIDGKTFSGSTNTISDAVRDTKLTVESVSTKKARISIAIDAPRIADQIETLFNGFNNAVVRINDALAGSLAFERDAEIQEIRQDLTLKPLNETRKIAERNLDIDAFRKDAKNQRATGIEVNNTGKKSVQETSLSSIIRKFKNGMMVPFENTQSDLSERLTSVGIRTLADDTFKVDRPELERALEVNTDEVLNLLTDSETGLLPLLKDELDRILKEGLGDIDLKREQVRIASATPDALANQLGPFAENAVLKGRLQNLIAVI